MSIAVLLKKELLEYLRSKKLISILLIFAFFGIVSPLTAYYIPEIMAYVAKNQNIKIELPPPAYQDAIAQYIKNVSQMCVFILILMTMGIVSNEKEKGTAIFVLVKPVKRYNFVLSKLTALIIILAISFLTSALCCSLYTYLFFEEVHLGIFFVQNILLMLYVLVILSATLMFSSIAKSSVVAGVLSFIFWMSLPLISLIGKAGRYSPDNLLAQAGSLVSVSSLQFGSIILSVFIIIILTSIALFYFERWEPR